MNADWHFSDHPSTACFTTTFVLDGSPILRVYHDYDGAWQFHSDSDQPTDNATGKIVSLKQILRLDQSLAKLHDLPYGWAAERLSAKAKWRRFKNTPFPSFPENGYYLEDAVWLSEFLPDINPPDENVRENLVVGDYVKLIFRFAAEDSERRDGECERIWVQLTGHDDDGNYLGTIENDPYHQAAALGDTIHFHPLHVAHVDREN